METFSALLAICAGNSPVTDEFPSQRPVTRGFDVSLICALNKWSSKQSWGWWFQTSSRSLWRHCNVYGLLPKGHTLCGAAEPLVTVSRFPRPQNTVLQSGHRRHRSKNQFIIVFYVILCLPQELCWYIVIRTRYFQWGMGHGLTAFLNHGPLARYVKLWVVHAPGMPGTFFPPSTSKENAS